MELDDLLEGEGLDAAGLEDALAWARRRAAELCRGVEQDPELGPLLDGAAAVSSAPLPRVEPVAAPRPAPAPVAESAPSALAEEDEPEPEVAAPVEPPPDDAPAPVEAAPSEVAVEPSPTTDERLGDDDGFDALDALEESDPDPTLGAEASSDTPEPAVDDPLLGDDSGFDAEPSPTTDELLGDDDGFDALEESDPEDELLADEASSDSLPPATDGSPEGDGDDQVQAAEAAEDDGNRFGLPEDPPYEEPSAVEAALASVPDPYDEETYAGVAPTGPEPEPEPPPAEPEPSAEPSLEDELAAAQAEVEAAAAAVAQLEAQHAAEAQQAAEAQAPAAEPEPALDPLAGIDFDDLPGDDEDYDDEGPGPLDAMGDAASPFDGGEPTIAGMQAPLRSVDVTQSMQATDFDGIEVTERAVNPLLAGAPSEVAEADTHSMKPSAEDAPAEDAPAEDAPAEDAPAQAAGDEEEIVELDEFEFLDEDELELVEEDPGSAEAEPEWKQALSSAQLGGGHEADEQSGLLRPPTGPPGSDEPES